MRYQAYIKIGFSVILRGNFYIGNWSIAATKNGWSTWVESPPESYNYTGLSSPFCRLLDEVIPFNSWPFLYPICCQNSLPLFCRNIRIWVQWKVIAIKIIVVRVKLQLIASKNYWSYKTVSFRLDMYLI